MPVANHFSLSSEKASLNHEKSPDHLVFTDDDQSTTIYKKEPLKNNIDFDTSKMNSKKNLLPHLVIKIQDEDVSDSSLAQQKKSFDPNCHDCLKDLIDSSANPALHNLVRLSAADALLESETKEGIAAFVTLIIDAFYNVNFDLKDSLVQLLADVDSIKTAKILADILTGDVPPFIDWSHQPEVIKYAIEKSIRSVSDKESVGEMIADKYLESPLNAADQILSLNNGIASARLAVEALNQGDLEKAEEFIEMTANADDSSAIDGMMLMVRKQAIEIDKASELLSKWNINQLSNHNHFQDLFVEYLTNNKYSTSERSLAALVLAKSNDKSSLEALKKASAYAEKSNLKDNFDKAIAHFSHQ
ncbi:hypothetical protein MHK_005192 [Candidatus Magnetomorum sp. HK-1]|nr:hypothetical protein MHK_005192 [Candidatus Magnetomorum sp. HK-1]